MPFEYSPYKSPYTAAITELITRQGDIAANRALQEQQARALTVGNIVKGVTSAIDQYRDYKALAPQRELQNLQLQQARQTSATSSATVAARSRFNQLVASGPTRQLPNGAAVPDEQAIGQQLRREGIFQYVAPDFEELSKQNLATATLADTQAKALTTRIQGTLRYLDRHDDLTAEEQQQVLQHQFQDAMQSGAMTPAQYKQYVPMLALNPAQVIEHLRQITPPSKPDLRTVGGDMVQVDEEGNITPVYSGRAEPVRKPIGQPFRVMDDEGRVQLYQNFSDGTRELVGRAEPRGQGRAAAGGGAAAQVTPSALTSQQQAYVDMVANGQMTLSMLRQIYPARRDGGVVDAIVSAAKAKNPDLDLVAQARNIKLASDVTTYKQVASINGVIPVLRRIIALSNEMPSFDVPKFNELLRSANLKIGDQTISNFRQLQTLAGDELGTALGVGGASDLKTRLGLELTGGDVGRDALQNNINEIIAVLQNRVGNLTRDWPKNLKPTPPPDETGTGDNTAGTRPVGPSLTEDQRKALAERLRRRQGGQ